jgi:hypothetical protein
MFTDLPALRRRNYMRESTRSSHHLVTPYRFRVVCQILHARNAAAGDDINAILDNDKDEEPYLKNNIEDSIQ